MGINELKRIAIELVMTMRQIFVVGCAERVSAGATIRVFVRCILRKDGYSRDLQ